ncbi:MAG: type II secretion system F family protein [bacterium]|nr:type II secretion system F family protein [bacterium]
MKKFTYEVRDKATDRIEKGEIQADNERLAGKMLMERGYVPLKIRETDKENFYTKYANRITTKDKIVFTRQFATLVNAGLPLAQGLRTVSEQTENKKMRSVIDDILASVEAGSNLVDSFSKHPEVFDKVYLALIGAGEISGTLDESLRRIAAQQEKDAAMMSKIRGAMTYPLIVLAVIMLVVAYMMIAVVPQVEQLYKDLGEEIPAMTAFLVAGTNFLTNFWWLVFGALGVAIWFFMNWLKTNSGIRFAANFKLNVPMFNDLFRKLYMARFARTGQLLLSTGVAMSDMLRITSEAVNNVIIQEQLVEADRMVQGGKSLSDSLRDREYILLLVPQMISIGEQSGKIDEMLEKTAKVYEDELDEKIKAISTMIEPILMVVMAVVAGGLVGAILMPIYGLVNKV